MTFFRSFRQILVYVFALLKDLRSCAPRPYSRLDITYSDRGGTVQVGVVECMCYELSSYFWNDRVRSSSPNKL
jgi:hypothetical protein